MLANGVDTEIGACLWQYGPATAEQQLLIWPACACARRRRQSASIMDLFTCTAKFPMPSPRLSIAAAALMLAALPAYFADTQSRWAIRRIAAASRPAQDHCPAARRLDDGRCECESETNWSDVACVAKAPILRRRVGAVVLGRDLHSDNCVLFARLKVNSLPFGLQTWQGKLAIINAHSPRPGDVAVIRIHTGVYKDVGHVAIVETVTGNSIAILEANYYAGNVSRRTAIGADADDAARMLGIAGYFRP